METMFFLSFFSMTLDDGHLPETIHLFFLNKISPPFFFPRECRIEDDDSIDQKDDQFLGPKVVFFVKGLGRFGWKG